MPRIYVAILAAYNAAILHGAWIEAAQEPTDLVVEIQNMLKTCPEKGEEYAIHDFEDFFGYRVAEYESLKRVAKIAVLIEEHKTAFGAFLELYPDEETDNLESNFTDCFQGEYDDAEDYAAQFLEDSGLLASIPETLRYYFDYKAYWRDLELGGDIDSVSLDGKVYVFTVH